MMNLEIHGTSPPTYAFKSTAESKPKLIIYATQKAVAPAIGYAVQQWQKEGSIHRR